MHCIKYLGQPRAAMHNLFMSEAAQKQCWEACARGRCSLAHLCMLQEALALGGLLLAQATHALRQLTRLPRKQLAKSRPTCK